MMPGVNFEVAVYLNMLVNSSITPSTPQARGQLLNFKSQGGDTLRGGGGDDFRQLSRGGTSDRFKR